MTSLLKALFMGLNDFPIHIGVNPHLADEYADGTIHTETDTGQIHHVHFVADNPKRLRRPSAEQISSLFDQAKRLGYRPRHIETHVGRRHRVYAEPNLSVVLDHQTA